MEQQKKLIGCLTQLDSVEGDPAWECVQTRYELAVERLVPFELLIFPGIESPSS